MSRIASMLRQEITRLARKEVNAGVRALRKTNAQHRRDIARLKRQAGLLARQVAYLERQEGKRTAQKGAEPGGEGRRFSPRGMKTHRKKLGLSAPEYARLVGVSAQTVYNWEGGKSRPADPQFASLATVRGLGKREARKRLELLGA